MFQLPKNISEERLCFNAKNCSVKDVIHSAYFQNQFNQFVAEEHGESCINCSISTTSIIVFLCINACLMIFIFLWAIKGNNKKISVTKIFVKLFSRKKFNLYSKIKGACQDIPYDHVEDEDGLMLQQPKNSKSSGLMTIVKIKKKACVCLKDLNQFDDYDNFV